MIGKISKIFWSIRAVLYKPFMGSIKFPSYIGKPKFIKRLSGLYFGKKVRIYPGLRVELEGNNSKITIGNNVSIGQDCHFVSSSDNLQIGNNVVISGNVLITNCDHNYKDIDVFLYDQGLKNLKTEIGDNSFIGYGAVILAGTTIGKQCVVASNSVVRGSFEDYCVIAGSPARVVKKYNKKRKMWVKYNG